ncbi:hypothetical protein [Hymenobacter cellulosivorans]|uniref:Cryptochrome/DNA photolyase FAD-binding domain-containing protein n=1 Tax=Hymenobacter cellulosivorans TaxID=2932249 RepID=A0ABY4FAG7_9BACT|nr:hypothetical protein [Hymenobacter cellulosivorans]UOQ52919.1 hypothetical protein MUN80_24665 [Hymenobacter cellulosivorans]
MDVQPLYGTLRQRRRPEDVAELLLPVLEGRLSPAELTTLRQAAAHSLRRGVWQYTAMLQTFRQPVGASRQVQTAAELFDMVPAPALRYEEAGEVEAFLQEVNPLIGKTVGRNNYRTDRLDRAAREAQGLDLSKRQYNKRFRAVRHLEEKLLTMLAEQRKVQFEQIAKSGLAHTLSYEEFAQDVDSAAFIAYYTARCNLRSEFTISGQQRPYDQVADMLFRRCAGRKPSAIAGWLGAAAVPASPSANWWAIAHVYPAPEVLAALNSQQQGELLGRWTTLLHEMATYLGHIWARNTFARETMVVKQGDDSSTWNAAAGSWNKARDAWMNLLYALGMEFVLEEMCFGKALRLMAADVVAWHYSAGQKLDPNTQVWATLPLPWEVFAGTARCTRAQVELACQQAGLDPLKSGWLAPRPHGVVPFRPTPELVHGVSVANPYLATVLKRHRYFSGKPTRPLGPEAAGNS